MSARNAAECAEAGPRWRWSPLGTYLAARKVSAVVKSAPVTLRMSWRRSGCKRRLAGPDLRRLCVSDERFANAIEPSHFGGREIAMGIKGWLDCLGRYGSIG